jgi:hypothetical protein
VDGWKENSYKEYWNGNPQPGELEADQGKDGLKILKKISSRRK